jgi:cytochrome c oxidase subunit 2
MKGMLRPRGRLLAALTVVLALALIACGQEYPNTTFDPHTEFGRDIDDLWDTLLFWGTIVFVLVEAVLIFVIVRYRRRVGRAEPKHVHGNTTLEILWTILPAVILVLIAVPTVRTIFRSQAAAGADAIQVNVIGHQWWWEFEYPQYGVKTANELYLPNGRTANFSLRTADVLHSFWIPQLGGKRDLISNRTNYLWFTPDSTLGPRVWNGFCAEFCGASHANMKFRVFTVPAADFERWVAHQRTPALVRPAAPTPPAGAAPAGAPGVQPAGGAQTSAGQVAGGAQPAAGTAGAAAIPAAEPFAFPGEIPEYAIPNTPIPAEARIEAGLTGDAQRGAQIYSRTACIGCHVVTGIPASVGIIGPNITHVGSRTTIGAGLYRNDPEHLAAWVKNAPAMKPGSLMPPMGRGVVDPRTGAQGTLDDQQIADIVAFLLALK